LYGASFEEAVLVGTNLENATLAASNLAGAYLLQTNLKGANLRGANLAEIRYWNEIEDISGANIAGITNPPRNFREWAIERGALEFEIGSPVPLDALHVIR
jgi:uncharacterized protein YjbI with pentapeptide repeats